MLSVPKRKTLHTQRPQDHFPSLALAQANVPAWGFLASAGIPWVVWVCQLVSVCSPAGLGALQGRGTSSDTPVASRPRAGVTMVC